MPGEESVCRTCCRGIYSCRWRRTDRPEGQCACCAFCYVTVVSLLASSWMYVCWVALNDRDDVNWKAFEQLKLWVSWFMVVVIISSLLTTYCCLLMLFALFQFLLKESLDFHCIHKVLLGLAVLLISAGVAGISLKWQDEWKVVILSFQATAPFLQLGAVAALPLFSVLVFKKTSRVSRAVSKVLILAAFVAVTIAIFISPIFIESPCIVDKLPDKPGLFGHRGAPMLAPENTIMSFNKSAECKVIAFETDVLISKDGVPFLMHDLNLLRTTNVLEKYPNLANNKSTDFTWAQIQQLNSGTWFLQKDPFHTARFLSKEEQSKVKNATVPSLSEFLNLAKTLNISVIFDLKNSNNNSYDTDLVVNTILNSGIPHRLVLWLPSQHRAKVIDKAPDFQQVYGSWSDEDLNRTKWLNINYARLPTKKIKELRQKNISVNLWVVNEPWLFSLLWCSSASSVTTNNCHYFRDMDHPVWYMDPKTYRITWITVDVASLLIMLVIWMCDSGRLARCNRVEGITREHLVLPSRVTRRSRLLDDRERH